MPELQRPDTHLYYELAGEGPPLLMIQGAGAVGEGWRPQVEGLRHAFTCCIFDNRGIGRSGPAPGRLSVEQMAEDTLALMDHLGWESAHVMGHSVGGLISQQLALDAPERVRSLVLMCTFHRGAEVTRLRWFTVRVGVRMQIGTRRMRRRAFMEMVLTPEELASGDTDALAQELAPVFGRDLAESPPIVFRQTLAAGRHDAFARLVELSEIPTLVMSARRDRVAPAASGRALAEAIPGARYLELEGAHGLPLRRAEEVNALLLEQLRTWSTPGAPG